MACIHNPRAFFTKVAIAAGIFSVSIAVSAPTNASVLVEPLIRRGAVEAQPTPSVNQSSQSQSSQSSDNIVEVANSTTGFSTLSAALKAANLGSILSGEGPFTVFAPTDAAFAALPAGTLESLLKPENRDLLVKLLYNHVGYGEFTSDRLDAGTFETFDGSVNVAVIPTGVTIDTANVVQADVDASNGIIHAIDKVLLPAGFANQLQARANGTSTGTSTATTSAPASSTSRITSTTPLQNRVSAPVAPGAPVAPAAPVSPVAPAAPVAPRATAPAVPAAAPAAPAEQAQPVRGLW